MVRVRGFGHTNLPDSTRMAKEEMFRVGWLHNTRLLSLGDVRLVILNWGVVGPCSISESDEPLEPPMVFESLKPPVPCELI